MRWEEEEEEDGWCDRDEESILVGSDDDDDDGLGRDRDDDPFPVKTRDLSSLRSSPSELDELEEEEEEELEEESWKTLAFLRCGGMMGSGVGLADRRGLIARPDSISISGRPTLDLLLGLPDGPEATRAVARL